MEPKPSAWVNRAFRSACRFRSLAFVEDFMHRVFAVFIVVGISILATCFAPASAQATNPGASADAVTVDGSMIDDTSMVPVAPARFIVDIDGLETGFPDDQRAGGLIPHALRARDNLRITRAAIATLRSPDGTPVKVALDSMFSVVVAELAGLDLQILSLDTLHGTVPYVLGYPIGNASSVVADGAHDRAIEIDIDVTVPDQGTAYWAVVGTGRSKTKGRPEMYLRIRYVDSSGETWREKVRVRSKERVELGEKWLLGVQTNRDVSDASSLFELTREATRRIVQNRTDARAVLDTGGR
jgi:hypothetical protein